MDDRFEPAGPGFHDYSTEEGSFGSWRRYAYPGGAFYAEYRSHAEILGFPLVHYTKGVCPETGRRTTAKGFIAVGRKAVGFIALGQLALGIVAVGQACAGFIAIGQAAGGFVSLCQVGFGWRFCIGQLVAGEVVIGQIAIGRTVLAQIGAGNDVWSPGRADPEAVAFFEGLLQTVLSRLGIVS